MFYMRRRFLRNILKITKNEEELQYSQLISDILENGELQKGRNGNVYSKFGASMRFSLKDNTLPLLTTKKVAWKTCLKELLWFTNGKTDNKLLQNENVTLSYYEIDKIL